MGKVNTLKKLAEGSCVDACIVQVKEIAPIAADKPTTPGFTFGLVYFLKNCSKGSRYEQGRGRPYL